MSVIEAMLTGLPVVATDIRGPREQVVPEVTGLLVPPASVAPLAAALRRLAGDPARRAAMGEAGRARALDLYDEAKVLARTLALLGVPDLTRWSVRVANQKLSFAFLDVTPFTAHHLQICINLRLGGPTIRTVQ